jgi:hypothetical protein
MRIILDSNEYILGLDTTAGPSSSSRLLDVVRILIDESAEFRLLVPEIIVREVRRNLPSDLESHFFMGGPSRHISVSISETDIRRVLRVFAKTVIGRGSARADESE